MFFLSIGWLLLLSSNSVLGGDKTTKAPSQHKDKLKNWWKDVTIYQIYPRSFKDSDGNGIGDLAGIESELEYLKSTGIGAAWLSPIYESPMKDFGYDITNYTKIDPLFGDMDIFKQLVTKMKKLGLKIIMDFVPNHTSNTSVWFQKSVKREDPYTDYYVWVDGKGNHKDQLPNNWLGMFGGPAWKWVPERKQFYYHQFIESQPDLNIRNPKVRRELTNVLRFWLDHGVSGFRIDAVKHLFESRKLLDEPPSNDPTAAPGEYNSLIHKYTTSDPKVLEVMYEWRAVLDEYERKDGLHRIMMVEINETVANTVAYYGNDTHPLADIPFNFEMFKIGTTVSPLRLCLVVWVFAFCGLLWLALIGNHDQPRIANRTDDRLIDAYNMLNLLLPGLALTYYGEEIGMVDTFVTWEETQDPFGLYYGPERYSKFSRDPQRSPMQWSSKALAGFTTGQKSWLPVNKNYKTINVKTEKSNRRSNWATYRRLQTMRQSPAGRQGGVEFPLVTETVLCFTRALESAAGDDGITVVINFGDQTETVDLTRTKGFPKMGRVGAFSDGIANDSPLVVDDGRVDLSRIKLPAKQAKNKIPPMATPDETTKMTEDATKVKFINANNSARTPEANRNGEAKIEIANIQVAFAGMGKDELMKFANDPFWIRLRWSLFLLFWLSWISMLVGAIVIIVQAPRCPPLPTLDWWQRTVVYQIYPRSFKDSDGDGVGDLKGIESKVDYVADLGVKAVWLNPIFKSPMKDFGYDVSDYKAVDPVFGTEEDFRSMVETFKSKDIKVILDFVPNHTSNNMTWFESSRNREEPYTDYYVWHNGTFDLNGKRHVPNNWMSVFGGSAWTFDTVRQQYYLHQFLPEQPDLNLRNEAVKQELKDVLTFWMDLGVRGFRIDAVSHLYEDTSFLDEPMANASDTRSIPENDYDYLDHIFTKGQPENIDLIKEWRVHFDIYSEINETEHILLMVESTDKMEDVMKMYGNGTDKIADFPFNFELVDKLSDQSTATDVLALVHGWLFNLTDGAWPNWVLGNHDQMRIATKLKENIVDGLHMITMLVTGTPVTYYGEEIGMEDVDLSFSETKDPVGLRNGESNFGAKSRDPGRTPMQWNNDSFAGFTNSSFGPWLPVNSNYQSGVNVEAELKSTHSHLTVYKKLVKLRDETAILYGSVGFLEVVDDVFGFTRVKKGSPGFIILVNFGENATDVDLSTQPEVKPINYVGAHQVPDTPFTFPDDGNIELCSSNVPIDSPLNPHTSKGKVRLNSLPLGPKEAVLIKFMASFAMFSRDDAGEDQVLLNEGERTFSDIRTGSICRKELKESAYEPFWVRLRRFLFVSFWVCWLSMFVSAIFVIAQAPRCSPILVLDWWQTSVIYRIYPLSFQDSDGDGFGDLKGIESRVDYLSGLGVRAVLLNDFSCDEDYTAIEPLLGSLKDFKDLVEKLKSSDMKLILDFVPNHTSNTSVWFEKSRRRVEPYTNYYVWHDGKMDGPPNNWLSVQGGSAWSFDQVRRQYYLHQFLPDQPDLNLRSKQVQDELEQILVYWLDLGVRGFQINSASYLYEDSLLRDEYHHINSPENAQLISQWRSLLDDYSEQHNNTGHIFLTVETSGKLKNAITMYGNETEKIADFPLNFHVTDNLNSTSNATDILQLIRDWLDAMPHGAWPNWALGDHNRRRVASKLDIRLIDGLHMITTLLPGTPITYYGEEIGLRDLDTIDASEFHAPMPWSDDEPNAGFTNASEPWLPLNFEFGINVATELRNSSSHLRIYRKLLKFREEPCVSYGSVGFLQVVDDVFGFARVKRGAPGLLVLVNFGDNLTNVDLSLQPRIEGINYVDPKSADSYRFPRAGNVKLPSRNVVKFSNLKLDAKGAMLVKFAPDFSPE
uniref:alpha-glucosidase n=1 Tax=Strigamia maritima TaxID=126957 RepID=T1JED2_STRMM